MIRYASWNRVSDRTGRAASGALLLLATLLLAGCDVRESDAAAAVGSKAPEYTALTLDGEEVSLASLRGDVVLLNIWATWCVPCRVEIPELQQLHERFADRGLRVVGVSVDVGGNGPVERFADELGVGYEILRDPSDRASSTFSFIGIPGTVLIDREGDIVWRHLGPVTVDDPGLTKALAAALSSKT